MWRHRQSHRPPRSPADGEGTGEDGEAGSADDGTATAADGDACADVDLTQAPEEPLQIRFGHGIGASEPILVQFLDPEVAGAEHYGTWYEMDATEFSPPDRLAAHQAGQLDAGTMSYPQMFTAIDVGLDVVAVTSLNIVSEEEEYRYPYVSLADSGIETAADLEGKTIGHIAPNTTTEYWAISALRDANLDPDQDVQFVSVPPPTAEEAVRTGQVDLAFIPNTFLTPVLESGDFNIVFDAYTATGFTHPNLDIWWDRGFLLDNVEAYCAWRSDYQNAMTAFIEEPEAVGAVLIEAGIDPAPSPEAFAERPHSGVNPDGVISVDSLQKLLDHMIETGFLEELGINAEDVVLEGYSLTSD